MNRSSPDNPRHRRAARCAAAAMLFLFVPVRDPEALTLKARSVSLPGPPGKMCVLALDQSGKLAVGDVDFSGTTQVDLSGCDLYNNSGSADSTEISGSAALTARDIYLAGGYSISGSATISAGAIVPWGSTVADPYAALSVPIYSGCAATNYKLNSKTPTTISPGVYCGGIDVEGGASLTLNPGTYILDRGNLQIASGATVTGNGVTLILTSSTGSNYGSISIAGSSTVTLSAPSANANLGVPGIALWEDRNAPTGSATFSGGSAQSISGAIYLPTQQVSYTGGSSTANACVQLVALTLKFSGNSYFQHNCTNAGVSDPPTPPRVVE